MSDASIPPILVLGRDTCEDTIRSRAFMDGHRIAYAYGNVEVDPEADAQNRSYNGGKLVTPTILIGDPLRPSSVLREPTDEDLMAAIAEVAAAG